MHIRTEGIRHVEYTEVMLQYALLVDHEIENGISIFAQLNLPTGPVEEDKYKGLFGISGRLTLPDVLTWDGNVHFDLDEDMVEHENSVVFRANDKFYPILEIRGHIGDDVNDMALLARVGLSVSVADASPELKNVCDIVTTRSGGRGAVREVAEMILKAQGRWDAIVAEFS